jgi:hypothetical protein
VLQHFATDNEVKTVILVYVGKVGKVVKVRIDVRTFAIQPYGLLGYFLDLLV